MVQENWVTYVDKLKKYNKFSVEERRNFVIAVLVIGFLYSFRYWGDTEFDWGIGLINLAISIIIVFITLGAHHGLQRLHAMRLSYKPEFKLWPYGLFGSLLVCFLSNGVIIIPVYGGTELHMIYKHRLGHFRFGVNMVNIGLVGFTGPLTNLLLAYFIKLINIAIGSQILERMVLINLMFAVWTMLPIPPLNDGIRILYWSRITYAFMLGVVVSAALLIWFSNNFFFILFGSLFIGAVLYVVYYLAYEEDSFEV